MGLSDAAESGQVIHYHGLPITPEVAAVEAISGGHAFVSHAYPDQLRLAVEICQSFAIDNGAFSAWKRGAPVTDWRPFYAFVNEYRRMPSFDWAVIPDVIDGDEAANDELVEEWPLARWEGAPVWHLHESLERLERLVASWPRICFGSSGQYSSIGTPQWETRMEAAMAVVCDAEGFPRAKLHGLRMLGIKTFTRFPFASADSTNIGRNIGIDQRWKGAYTPNGKPARARLLRGRIEAHQSPARYELKLW